MAILLVLFYHYVSTPPGQTSTQFAQGIFAIGWSGVDLFFVLSGFLIGGILLDVRESPNYFKTFYGRRFYRIVPLYYLWIAIYFSFEAFRTAPETWRAIPIYALFLQNSVKIEHGVLGTAWLGALWSLAVEEQFYLVAPAVVRFLSGRKLIFVLVSAIVCAPLFRIAIRNYVPAHPAAPYMLTACRADALAMGVLLAVAWRNEKWKSLFHRFRAFVFGACLLLLAAFLYLAIWNPSQYSPAMYAWGFSVVDALFAILLAIAILVPHSTWAAICRFRFFAEMGRVSYCLYVIHQAVDLACHKLLLHTLPRFDTWQTVLVSMVAAVVGYGLAALSWRFFEDPLLRRGHSLKY